MDLKQTYEGLLAEAGDAATAKKRPANGLARPAQERAAAAGAFRRGDAGHRRSTSGIPLRQLLRRGIELRDELPELSPLERERLPDYATWWHHRERIAALAAIVQDIRRDGILAKHPLRRLSPRLAAGRSPAGTHHRRARRPPRSTSKRSRRALGRCGVPREQWQTLATARSLVDYAKQVLPVARIGTNGPAGPDEPDRPAVRRGPAAIPASAGGPGRGPAGDRGLAAEAPGGGAAGALEQAKAFEQSFFAWLRPAWWRLRRILNESLRLPLARGSPALVAGARGAGEGIRRAGRAGQRSGSDRRAVPARRRR